jgi:flagellar hook-length control protein FliK
MTDLPISISNAAPAQPAANRMDKNSPATQDEQAFGNVLTRQLADTDKPSQPEQAAGKDSKQPGKEDVDTAPASAETATAPAAEMLAALLTQQNQAATPQPENVQPQLPQSSASSMVADVQFKPDAQLKPGTPPKQANSQTIPGSGKDSGITPELLAGAAIAAPENAGKDKMQFASTLKTKGATELLQPAFTGTTAQHGNLAGELTNAILQAPAPLSAAATPANSTTIGTPISQAAWGDEFGQKITWMATQRNQSAELHLNPPQLGPLDITLKMNGDQATALFTSPHAAVREAIEQALPKLREMLADNGIMLNNAMVSDQQTRNEQDNAARKSQTKSSTSSANEIETVGTHEARTSRISRHNGMVDTFA